MKKFILFFLFVLFFLVPYKTYGVSLVSDGFDYPVGKPDHIGYYNVQGFGETNNLFPGRHLGEDWNKNCNGNCDKDDPVFSVSNGTVRFSKQQGLIWGRVIIIEHILPSGEKYYSQYGHLNEADAISEGAFVQKGEKIGSIRDGIKTPNFYMWAHLHFEIRADANPKKLLPGPGYYYTSLPPAGWLNPSSFISSHRPLISDPITLSSTNTTSTSTTLNWNKPTFSNFDHYELYRSAEQNGTTDPAKRTNILEGNDIARNIETTSFIDSSLSSNTPYYYSLSAFDANGFSVSSNEITTTTGSGVKNITNNQYDQRFPRINEKYVVWSDGTMDESTRLREPFLFGYDILNDKPFVLKNLDWVGSRSPNNLNLYGDSIVYDAGSSSRTYYGDSNIYYYNLGKKDTLNPGIPITTAPYTQIYPDIYGDYVVWTDFPANQVESTIHFIDLSSGWQGPGLLVKEAGHALLFAKIW